MHAYTCMYAETINVPLQHAYVCVYLCMYIYIYTYMCIYVYHFVYVYIYMYTHVTTCASASASAYTDVDVDVCKCKFACICICIYVYLYIYIDICLYLYTHTLSTYAYISTFAYNIKEPLQKWHQLHLPDPAPSLDQSTGLPRRSMRCLQVKPISLRIQLARRSCCLLTQRLECSSFLGSIL